MTKVTAGILAHVDAGKTTLSEAMLYHSGVIRSLGRVDRGDAFLDTNGLEKARGITIFSKQAILTLGDREVTLLTRRATWIFPRRWSVRSRCWITRFFW